MYFTSALILVVLTSVEADDDCASSKSNIPIYRLKNDLLCDYDADIRPVLSHENATMLKFNIFLKQINYEHEHNTLAVDAWLSLVWNDQHLTWNPDDYDKLSEIRLSTSDIWTPDLSIYNSASQGQDPTLLVSTTCMIYSIGRVVCVQPQRLEALCVADLTNFPFDEQNCNVLFGSWLHSGEELDVQTPGVHKSQLRRNGEWLLSDTKTLKHPGHYPCCSNSTYPTITVSLKVQRQPGTYASTVLIPSAVVILLTLISLCMSPADKNRFILCCINITFDYLHIQYISWMVPMVGHNTPKIVLLGRDCLLLGSFTVIFTVVFKSMMQKTTVPPSWVTLVVSFVTECGPGRFLFLDDTLLADIPLVKSENDGTALVDKILPPNRDWAIFAKILDRLSVFTYVIVYICLLSLIP